jgi:putative PIN family toxin of toxin-antitoxin system
MRVLLDANIFISYLLHPERDGPITQIIHGAIQSRFTLLLPKKLLTEFSARIGSKAYLGQRITPEEMTQLRMLLESVGEVIPEITRPIPPVTRDPKDDYLLAYAAVGRADYLVNGDEDLLVLERVAGVTICRPGWFVKILKSQRSCVDVSGASRFATGETQLAV